MFWWVVWGRLPGRHEGAWGLFSADLGLWGKSRQKFHVKVRQNLCQWLGGCYQGGICSAEELKVSFQATEATTGPLESHE